MPLGHATITVGANSGVDGSFRLDPGNIPYGDGFPGGAAGTGWTTITPSNIVTSANVKEAILQFSPSDMRDIANAFAQALLNSSYRLLESSQSYRGLE